MRAFLLLLVAEWRELKRHPLQWGFTLLGVALAVALVIGVDTLTQAAARGYQASLQAAHGARTHALKRDYLSDTDYVVLRARWRAAEFPSIAAMVPVLSGRLRLADGRLVQLLGTDVFAAGLSRSDSASARANWENFFAPGVLMADDATASRFAWHEGDLIQVITLPGKSAQFSVSVSANESLGGLLLGDLATVQELTNQLGRLDRIELHLRCADEAEPALSQLFDPQAPCAEEVAELLAQLNLDQSRPWQVITLADEISSNELASAFYFNLAALSLLAAAVAGFLVHQVGVLEVTRRMRWIGQLRALGMKNSDLVGFLLVRAAILAAVAAALGVALGFSLARLFVERMLSVVTDLFYRSAVSELALDPITLLKAFVIALVVVLIATAVTLSAARGQSLIEQIHGDRISQRRSPGIWPFVLCAASAFIVLRLTTASWGALVSVGLLLVAVTPLIERIAVTFVRLLRARFANAVYQVALADLGRTARDARFATGALVVAMSATTGMGLMIDSFERALVNLLDDRLRPQVAVRANLPIDPGLVQRLRELPNIQQVTQAMVQETKIDNLQASLRLVDAPQAEAERLGLVPTALQGGIAINEPLARRLQLELGDSLHLDGVEHRVSGVFKDYGNMKNQVVMAGEVTAATELLLYGEVGRDQVSETLAAADVLVVDQASVRDYSLQLFDRTFLLTEWVRVLAMAVAAIALLVTLLTWMDRRLIELGVLRAIGFTAADLVQVLGIQTVLLGAIALVVALPLGVVVGWILVTELNPRAFLWSYPLYVDATPLMVIAGSGALAILVALLLPAWRLRQAEPVRWINQARHG